MTNLLISSLACVLVGFVAQTSQLNDESFCDTLDKKHGVCISIKTQIKQCAPLYDMLKNREWDNLRKNICDINSTRVCCPLNGFNELSKPDPEVKYDEHPNFKFLPRLSSCGLSYSLSDRIIGGNSSKPGEFPWMVRLGFQDKDGGSIWYICGGTLISKRYVLTAAHCFKHPEQKLVKIILGQTDEDAEEECIESDALDGSKIKIACSKHIEMKSESVIVHSGYENKIGSANDIALIRLAQDVDTGSYFTRPICLPFLNEYYVSGQLSDEKLMNANMNMTLVTGWGRTNNYEAIGSSTLQFVRVPIQPHIMCRVTYGSYNLTRHQICAGGVKNLDSCLGDSGGPLFIATNPEKESRSLRSFQLGIVSYGKTTCARGREPVVYTRVRSFLTWILDNIKS